jgi:hypothetical protein
VNDSNDVVLELRERALTASSAVELMKWLQSRLGGQVSPFNFNMYFFRAFGIPLEKLRSAENWHGFGGRGSLSDEEVELLLSRWIQLGGR